MGGAGGPNSLALRSSPLLRIFIQVRVWLLAGGQRMASGSYIRTYPSVVGPQFSRGSRGDAPERPRRQRRRLQATGAPLIETSFDNTKDKYLILGCPNIAAFGKL